MVGFEWDFNIYTPARHPILISDLVQMRTKKNVKLQPVEYKLRIQNCVVNGRLNRFFNLESVARACYGKVDSKSFPACTISLTKPRVTLSLFESGEIVAAGGRSKYESIYAIHAFVDMLWRLMGIRDVEVSDVKTCNIVGTAGVGYNLDLDLLSNDMQSKCTYDVELFPGLRMTVQGLRVVIFTSGKLIIAGADTEQRMQTTYAAVMRNIHKYKVGSQYREMNDSHRHRRRNTKVVQTTQEKELHPGPIK